jgi:hypothetical protein
MKRSYELKETSESIEKGRSGRIVKETVRLCQQEYFEKKLQEH